MKRHHDEATKFGCDESVVSRTKSRILRFAAPSLHDGHGAADSARALVAS